MITATQNIPVISYLLLRGKCAKCGAPISVRYPIIELEHRHCYRRWSRGRFGFTWYTAAL